MIHECTRRETPSKAVEWTGSNFDEVRDLIGKDFHIEEFRMHPHNHNLTIVLSNQSEHYVAPGMYLVLTDRGETLQFLTKEAFDRDFVIYNGLEAGNYG